MGPGAVVREQGRHLGVALGRQAQAPPGEGHEVVAVFGAVPAGWGVPGLEAGVVRGLGPDVGFERFDAPPRCNGEADRDELVAFTRRRLCLPAERDPEVAALLPPHGPRQHVTLWWDGGA